MFRGSIWGFLKGVPPNSVKMFASEICTDIKNTSIVNLVVQKFDFGEGPLCGGSEGKKHPQAMSKYLSVKYLLISKNKLALYFEPN